jgi:integrase
VRTRSKLYASRAFADFFPLTERTGFFGAQANFTDAASCCWRALQNGDSMSTTIWERGGILRKKNRNRALRRSRSAEDLREAVPEKGGDLEQIKFLLGHSSIQTTERYLGSEQDIAIAVNDNLGL